MKRQLPSKIEKQMKQWRMGMITMPVDYIEWHKELAEKALMELPVIVHRQWVAPDGWGDSMKVLHAIVENKNGELFKIRWHDGNQEFFQQLPHGGGSVQFK